VSPGRTFGRNYMRVRPSTTRKHSRAIVHGMRKIDAKGDACELVSSRMTGEELAWLNETWRELGLSNRSELLRRAVKVARQHNGNQPRRHRRPYIKKDRSANSGLSHSQLSPQREPGQ
jgi:hypothetical protein